jgi:predicted MPP superfamily phosphohydrolase
MNRRHFARNAAWLSATVPFIGSDILKASASTSFKKTSVKVAFLTDVHIKAGDIPQTGMRLAIRHINNQSSKPDFIINGGDSIMDALAATKDQTQAQWDIWNTIMKEENKLPIYHCIGNHDVWGWQVKDESLKSDPLYGKNWVVQQFKMPNRYYSFGKGMWHFIMLDSVHAHEGGYMGRLDEEQFQWLENELAQVPKNKFICLASHIPIASYAIIMFMDDGKSLNDVKIPRSLLHSDGVRLKNLFKRFPNVKVCLSGHLHLQDEVTYLGVKYYCNGAVSGAWWKGAFHEFSPSYALFDFHKDGTVSREMVPYDAPQH